MVTENNAIFYQDEAYWIVCGCGANLPPTNILSHKQIMSEAKQAVATNNLKTQLTYAVSRLICGSCNDEKNKLVLKSAPKKELDFKEAVQAFEDNRYDTALKIFSNLTECYQHPNSSAMLALMYSEGFGTEKNYEMAIKQYEIAKKQGINCFKELGYLYEWGLGTDVNFKAAKENYQAGYNAGDYRACYNLGTLYEHGRGVEEDIEKAIKLFSEAARNGVAEAAYNLGTLYLLGEKINADTQAGVNYLEISAEGGFAAAMRKLGFIYYEGYSLPIDLKEALKWFQMSILHGDSDGKKHCKMVLNEARKQGLELSSGDNS